MRRVASLLGRGLAIVAMGLVIAAVTGYLVYLVVTSAVSLFVQ
jgi:hypothetical protein